MTQKNQKNSNNVLKERSSYQALCAEYYDLYRPQASPEESHFYSIQMKNVRGPILEAMCGSGRLLIPLLREGYKIDGVDNAPHMLANCESRCKRENLSVTLFNQSLENLSLPKKYALIFIALGSFQHFADRKKTAFQAIQRLYDHLEPGGILLLDIIIPWGLIKNSIEGSVLSDEVKTMSSCQKVIALDGSEINLTTTATIYSEDQLAISNNRYEKVFNDKVLSTEEEQLAFRWYHRYEMELFLEKGGFSVANIWNQSFDPNLDSTVYKAIKNN